MISVLAVFLDDSNISEINDLSFARYLRADSRSNLTNEFRVQQVIR